MDKYIRTGNRVILLLMFITLSSFVSATTPLLIGNNPANVVGVSNSVIDLGQSTTFNVIVSNGIAPYTGNWMWIAPNTILANSLSITVNTLTANILSGTLINSVLTVSTSSSSTNTIQVTFNGITNTINLDSTHTVYGVWTFNANVLDSASNTLGSATQTTSNTVTINPTLALPTIAVSNTLVDANQYIRFSAYETGGTPPYTYNILVYNSVTNAQIGNFLSTTTNSFVFQAFAGNSIYANVIVKDRASTPITLNSILTPTIPVNAVLTTPTISVSGTSLNTEQNVTFYAYESAGTQPFTYNFIVYNSTTYTQVANDLTTSNSFKWSPSQAEAVVANVFVTDSSPSPATANSILSSVVTVTKYTSPPCGGSICGSGGTGVGSSVSTSISTTSTPSTTTTQPTTTISPVTTTIPPSVNQTYNVSNTIATNVTAPGLGLILTLLSFSKPSSVRVFVSNVTNSVPSPPVGFKDILAMNISVESAANVSTNVTLNYPCTVQASNIAPYKLKNGVWQPIARFTLNAAKCSIMFSITNDPIIGLFQNTTQPSTSIQTTTSIPITTVQTTVSQPSSVTSNNSYLVWIIVLIVIIVLVAWWHLNRGQKRRFR